jgi:hypothetical protein
VTSNNVHSRGPAAFNLHVVPPDEELRESAVHPTAPRCTFRALAAADPTASPPSKPLTFARSRAINHLAAR